MVQPGDDVGRPITSSDERMPGKLGSVQDWRCTEMAGDEAPFVEKN